MIACHECDLLLREPVLPPGGTAYCPRCGAVARRRPKGTIDHTLAWSVATLTLLVLANAFPIVALQISGHATQTTLMGGARALHAQGMSEVAALVLVTLVIAPALIFSLLIYLLAPVRFGRIPPGFAPIFRFIRKLGPWQMFDVFMLGIIVSVVKLTHLASVAPGPGLWAFLALMVASVAAAASFDAEAIWSRVGASAGIATVHPVHDGVSA